MEIVEDALRIQFNTKGAVYLGTEASIKALHEFGAISIGLLPSMLKQVLPTLPSSRNDKGVNKCQQMLIETGQLIHGYPELDTMFMHNVFLESG